MHDILRSQQTKRNIVSYAESFDKAIPRFSDLSRIFRATFHIKNYLLVRIQYTSGPDGMTSLERLSKDVIPSVLQLDCTRTSKQFFIQCGANQPFNFF